MNTRRIAYANSVGQHWPEDVWVRARMHNNGLTKEAAASEIEQEILAKKLVIVSGEKDTTG